VTRLLEELFPARKGERLLTLVLFFHSLFAVGAFVAARAVRDALFLEHVDRAQLAPMYIASAAAVALAGLAYGPIAARFRRDVLAFVSAITFGALFAIAFALEHHARPAFYASLYVYVEVMGALTILQFWTLANEIFHAREAKRLYGLIGSGGTLANVLVGLATSRIATRFGAPAVLLLCAGLLVGCAVASTWAGRLGRERLFARAVRNEGRKKRQGALGRVLASGHLRTIALLGAVTFFTTTLVDYEFKIIAGLTFPVDRLAAYFGRFYAVVGLGALALQFFGTSRVLKRAGVVAALAVLPLSLAGGNLALVLWPTLLAAATAKGADTLFRYTLNDATTQILYLPVPPQARASAKAFIDGVVKSGAIGLAGAFLYVWGRLFHPDPYRVAYVALAGSLLWGMVLWALRGHYIQSLQENLRSRRLDLESARHPVQDGSTGMVLQRALESGQPPEVMSALELLPHLSNIKLDDKVEALLDHALPEIRLAALRYFTHRQSMRHANSIFRRFEDPVSEIRAAAIDAFCAMGRDRAVKTVRSFLLDSDPAVRSAAITGMIRYGGLDGVLSAAEALKALIAHENAAMREHAAKVLGAIGVRNFYQPVLELMNDPVPTVRRAAIEAAAQLKSPEFVIPLIYKARSAETGSEAIEALCAFGTSIAATLGKVLANRLEDVTIRRGVARVLGRMTGPEAVAILLPHLDEPDEELRLRLYRSLARASRGQRLSTADRRQVDSALELELTRAYRALAAAETLGLGASASAPTPGSLEAGELLLSLSIADKVARTEQRVFLLLAVLYPDAGMEHILAGIRDAGEATAGRRRANAVELLDTLLDRRLKRRLLPLVEDAPRQERLREAEEALGVVRSSRADAIRDLLHDENAWVRACALYYATHRSFAVDPEQLTEAVADPNPIVRETALACSTRLGPERALQLAQARIADENPVVRRRAASLAGIA
jgi:AAA family ATP:ADP antiporter